MTSVQSDPGAVPARGPRCNGPGCGKPILHIPGKGRPKIYCSDACRKRAKRAIARNAETTTKGAGQSRPEQKTDAGFSSKGKSPSTAGQRGCDTPPDGVVTPNPDGPSGAGESERARPSQETARQGSRRDPRDERFERRDRHQTAALGEAFRACGNRLTGKAATLMAAAGEAAITGVCRCNNVHMCVWCGSRILAVRAANAQAMADGLAAKGYGLFLGTNTLRHFARQPFGSNRKGERFGLISVLHDGWRGAYGSAGRRWREDLRDAFGIVGYERAYEDTWGPDTGFHLHWHTLWVTKKPLDEEGVKEFRRALATAWADAVRASGGYEVSMSCDRPNCPCGGEGHGTDLRALNGGEEGETARYLYKDGDKGTAKIGLELSRQDLKEGRSGRLSPWQLGDAAAQELAANGAPGIFTEKYRERERGIFGVRKQYRTQNLNRLVRELGIPQDERTENEITDESGGLQPILVIPSGTWYRHIARVPGRRLDLVKVAEAHGVGGVRLLIESWGLRWGIDVFDPPTEDDPTAQAGEDEAARRAAELLARPAARTFAEHVHRAHRRRAAHRETDPSKH